MLTRPALSDRKTAWWDYGRKEMPYRRTWTCSLDPEHWGSFRSLPLRVALVGGIQQDFVWTSSECLIQPQVAEFLGEGGFTGYTLSPRVQTRYRNRKLTHPIPELYEILVHGKAGRLRTHGLSLDTYCHGCGRETYREVDFQEGVEVVQETWDSSDIFRAWPLPMFHFVSDRLAKALLKSSFTGFSLAPPEFFDTRYGASPGSYSDWLMGPGDEIK